MFGSLSERENNIYSYLFKLTWFRRMCLMPLFGGVLLWGLVLCLQTFYRGSNKSLDFYFCQSDITELAFIVVFHLIKSFCHQLKEMIVHQGVWIVLWLSRPSSNSSDIKTACDIIGMNTNRQWLTKNKSKKQATSHL